MAKSGRKRKDRVSLPPTEERQRQGDGVVVEALLSPSGNQTGEFRARS